MIVEITKNSQLIIAIAAGVSALVVFIGLIIAAAQLRALNRGAQLQNFIALTQEADSREFSRSYAEVLGMKGLPLLDKNRRIENGDAEHTDRITNFFERIAVLVRRKYLEKHLAINWWGVLAKDAYDALEDWIAHNQKKDPGMCSDFKWFVNQAEAHWLRCGRKRPT